MLTIAGVLFILGVMMAIGVWVFQKKMNKDDPEYLVQFIQEHAGTEKVSLSINFNDQKWVEVNGKKQLPLASTVKIIIAIEYAQQAAEGKIDPSHEVRLEELDTFYIPQLDGAHDAWIAQLSKGKETEKVPLSEIVNGMIAYSSNANTDYLMEVLGLENINQVPESLGMLNHQAIYPVVSALFIPSELMHEKGLTKQETLEALKSMDLSEYRQRAIDIHNKLHSHPLTNQEKEQKRKLLNMDVQKNWSDRLPGSTTEDYVRMMDILNCKDHFNENIHKYLDPVMEKLMENPNNRKFLVHAGQKGGSTAFIVTIAMYATDTDGNKTELAFFSNDLNLLEQAKLSRKLNGFQLKFLTNAEFRTYVKDKLSNL